mgnify:CR=1 FL=1
METWPGTSPSRLMTVPEVAELLRVHPRTVYRLIKKDLPARKVGRSWRIDAKKLDEYLLGSA